MSDVKGVTHPGIEARLRRIEGQVRGVSRMVQTRRYCIDVIQQLTAARRALDEVTLRIMRDHINGCVTTAIKRRDGAAKIEELMQTIHRFVK